jgi:alpha-mannosidase
MTVQVHLVSHTHWDREWYLTREQFRLRLVDLVDRVLDRLDRDPGFRFHLDGQTVVLEDVLEVRPEAEARLRAHVSSGRLLVGPWYVMPDQFLVSGEALLRNLEMGQRLAARFGPPMPVGYIPDPFGHVAQMPQLLRLRGLESAVLWRGLGPGPTERWWESPDGSRVLLLHLPAEGYCNALRLPLLPLDRMAEEAAALVAREAARSTASQVLLMAGVDHVEPHDGLDDLARVLARLPGVEGGLSTLPAYVEGARQAVQGATLEVVHGELRGGQDHAFLLPGVLSARIYLKQANARAQRELEHWAEPLSTFAWRHGAAFPRGPLDYAWRTLLQNHPHDSICGCSVDAVHEENVSRFARVQQVAEGIGERALGHLAAQLAPPPAGVLRCVVVHTDTRAFRGVLETAIDIPYESTEPGRDVPRALLEVPYVFVPPQQALASVSTTDGAPVAVQLLGEEEATVWAMSRFEPPWTLRARRLRLLIDATVPGCGVAALDLHFDGPAGTPTVRDPVRAGARWLENGALRVDVNADGTVDVQDKRSGIRYPRCLELEDTGDVGDEYTYCPPERDRCVTSADARGVRVSVVEQGPLRAGLRVELWLPLPRAATADRRARDLDNVETPVCVELRLASGAERIEATISVHNAARDHRLRVRFSTATPALGARADSAFALVERPAAPPPAPPGAREDAVATAPLLSLVDAGDTRAGLSLFADGLTEYELEAGDEGVIALTLLRCVGFLSRDDLATRRGHAGPGLPTPGAQCPGAHTFRVALQPRGAPPEAHDLFAAARAFLSPPRVFAHAGGCGSVIAPHTFLEVEGDVVPSACTLARDGEAVLVRAFNPAPREARASLRLAGGTAVAAPVRPYAIVSLESRS